MPTPLFLPRRAPDAPAAAPAPPARTFSAGGAAARGREAAALVLAASAAFAALALASFEAHPARPELHGPDWVGPVGASLASALAGSVGVVAWALVLELALLAWPLLRARASRATLARLAGDLLILLIAASLVHVAAPDARAFGGLAAGGTLGELFGELLRSLFSTVGSFLVGLTAVGLILIGRSSLSLAAWLDEARRFGARAFVALVTLFGTLRDLMRRWSTVPVEVVAPTTAAPAPFDPDDRRAPWARDASWGRDAATPPAAGAAPAPAAQPSAGAAPARAAAGATFAKVAAPAAGAASAKVAAPAAGAASAKVAAPAAGGVPSAAKLNAPAASATPPAAGALPNQAPTITTFDATEALPARRSRGRAKADDAAPPSEVAVVPRIRDAGRAAGASPDADELRPGADDRPPAVPVIHAGEGVALRSAPEPVRALGATNEEAPAAPLPLVAPFSEPTPSTPTADPPQPLPRGMREALAARRSNLERPAARMEIVDNRAGGPFGASTASVASAERAARTAAHGAERAGLTSRPADRAPEALAPAARKAEALAAAESGAEAAEFGDRGAGPRGPETTLAGADGNRKGTRAAEEGRAARPAAERVDEPPAPRSAEAPADRRAAAAVAPAARKPASFAPAERPAASTAPAERQAASTLPAERQAASTLPAERQPPSFAAAERQLAPFAPADGELAPRLAGGRAASAPSAARRASAVRFVEGEDAVAALDESDDLFAEFAERADTPAMLTEPEVERAALAGRDADRMASRGRDAGRPSVGPREDARPAAGGREGGGGASFERNAQPPAPRPGPAAPAGPPALARRDAFSVENERDRPALEPAGLDDEGDLAGEARAPRDDGAAKGGGERAPAKAAAPARVERPLPSMAPPARVERPLPSMAPRAPAPNLNVSPGAAGGGDDGLRLAERRPAPEAKAAPRDRIVPAWGEGFRLPSTALLEPPPPSTPREEPEALLARARDLEKVLANYGVKGAVADIHTGPTVSTFEVIPAEGTKVSKVASLADDLALGLSCTVRIIAPIPGKSRIGFELPNRERIPVSLRELVEDRRFLESTVPLPVVLGRDIVGAPYFADLASMPHVIVAGATGAGKSVGLNVMLTSLLTRRGPDELRMLMIDPKVVELAPFDRIPHMLLPVVTDMKQAATALKWAVDEMERRYQLFANAGTKNIGTYNAWVGRARKGEVKGFRPPQGASMTTDDGTVVEVGPAREAPPLPEALPYIVIVVDEFADLMMQQGKDVEAAVARLAQKARAAGMHVILATQRPSVDVITGMIKANFPTRVAFRVAQRVDSRTILDEQGAEHLLGRGDMLVKLNGTNETRRVQCPFVSEEEVQRVTDFLRAQGEPVYDENILKARDDEGAAEDDDDGELDPKYDDAVRVVAETRRCSTSWLQRKLGLGYNRAAKIVEAMEKRGLVGPAHGARDREVLIDPL